MGRRLTEQDRVKPVKEGDEERHREDDEEDVADDEVGREQAHLDELDDELSGGLREDVAAESAVVPHSGPPGPVDLVVLELSREEEGDEELVKEALDEARCDDTEDGVRDVPDLEEPEELKESNETDDRETVRDGGHRRSELGAAVVEHGSEEERDEEQDEQDDHVEDDRSERNNGDSEDTRDLLDSGGSEPAEEQPVRGQ